MYAFLHLVNVLTYTRYRYKYTYIHTFKCVRDVGTIVATKSKMLQLLLLVVAKEAAYFYKHYI